MHTYGTAHWQTRVRGKLKKQYIIVTVPENNDASPCARKRPCANPPAVASSWTENVPPPRRRRTALLLSPRDAVRLTRVRSRLLRRGAGAPSDVPLKATASPPSGLPDPPVAFDGAQFRLGVGGQRAPGGPGARPRGGARGRRRGAQPARGPEGPDAAVHPRLEGPTHQLGFTPRLLQGRLLGGQLQHGAQLLEALLQGRDEEANFCHALPLFQHPHRPAAGPKRPLQRRFVLGVLRVHVHGDVIRRRHHLGRVDPHDRGREVGPASPLLDRQGFVQRSDHAAEVTEDSLFGIPVGADLPGEEDEETSACRVLEQHGDAIQRRKAAYGQFRCQILEAEANERSVSGESRVSQRAHAIQLLKQAFPVRLNGNGARSVLAIQVRVQDVDGLLVHRGLKLAREERRTDRLVSSDCVSTPGGERSASGLAHLGGEQSVGVELLQPRHQLVLGVDDVLHEAAGEREPIGAARHLEAFGDAAFAETPHVVVTLVEEAVEALLLNEPATRRQSAG
ncbi:hypothetical protein EYF80_006377 [Liparis tanakae]|uniref:Uncharacterized protein n=1 Tax=Liparis tanakae TaxID=230148 RepID=A0A4Z2IZS0_9TELE|nr:hypothetical protein EYF80_006377 [Liparis tanakae]